MGKNYVPMSADGASRLDERRAKAVGGSVAKLKLASVAKRFRKRKG